MQTQYQKVKEFMVAFGQATPTTPKCPEYDVRDLRCQLIEEENLELEEAEHNIVSAFDAILDLLYVVLGSGIAYGISEEQIAKGLAEVHRSNMTKFWSMMEIDSEHFKEGYTYQRSNCERACYVVKDSSGKIIKSPSYSKANLGPILEGVK